MSLRIIGENRFDSLFPVVNKMSVQALCRFRQTSKQINDFVESNRHKFTAILCTKCHIKYHLVAGPFLNKVVNDQYIANTVFTAEMEKMRIKCETLYVAVTQSDELNVILAHFLVTKKVKVESPVSLRDLPKLPIKHINYEFRQINEWDRLSPYVKDYYDVQLGGANMKVIELMKDFLMEVRTDRTARGNLEHFAICGSENFRIFNLTDSRFHGRFESHPFKECKQLPVYTDVHKIEIDGGYALLIETSTCPPFYIYNAAHICFIRNDSREALFNAFSSYNERYDFGLDISNKKDDFLNARDYETAFSLLFREKK